MARPFIGMALSAKTKNSGKDHSGAGLRLRVM